MAFSSVAADNDLMQEGEYEVYVKNCGYSETKGGTECIKFEFVVRPDVEQPYQNKHKFKQFYRDRDTNQWPADKIGRYANALGIPSKQDFELEDLIGLNAIMVIKQYQDKETGDTKDCIFFLKPSKAQSLISAPPSSSGFVDLYGEEDGELPF